MESNASLPLRQRWQRRCGGSNAARYRRMRCREAKRERGRENSTTHKILSAIRRARQRRDDVSLTNFCRSKRRRRCVRFQCVANRSHDTSHARQFHEKTISLRVLFFSFCSLALCVSGAHWRFDGVSCDICHSTLKPTNTIERLKSWRHRRILFI